MEEKGDEFLKMIGSTGTKLILDFISEHGTAQYKDIRLFMNAHTLNRRLRELLICGFLEHHIEKEEKRMEWYTITEKGKKLVKLLREIIAFMD
jgi:DNA-binding HxlR family transcriptional regulator